MKEGPRARRVETALNVTRKLRVRRLSRHSALRELRCGRTGQTPNWRPRWLAWWSTDGAMTWDVPPVAVGFPATWGRSATRIVLQVPSTHAYDEPSREMGSPSASEGQLATSISVVSHSTALEH